MNTVVTVDGNLTVCSFANTGPMDLVDRRVNVSCIHFQHTEQSDTLSLPLSNSSVTQSTHADCNEYQSHRNEEKSKNISTYYVAALLRKVKRRKIDTDRRHIDLNSTERVTIGIS